MSKTRSGFSSSVVPIEKSMMLQSKAALKQGWIGKGKISNVFRTSYKGADMKFKEMKLRESKETQYKSIESTTLSGQQREQSFVEVTVEEKTDDRSKVIDMSLPGSIVVKESIK